MNLFFFFFFHILWRIGIMYWGIFSLNTNTFNFSKYLDRRSEHAFFAKKESRICDKHKPDRTEKDGQ